jgi:hypothetical protein
MYKTLFLILISINIYAQSNDDSTFNKFMKNKNVSFYENHIDKLFPQIGKVSNLNNNLFDFNKISKKTVIFFGFKACEPCHTIKKYFIDFVDDYKNIDFLYITFDDKETILNDFVKLDFLDKTNFMAFSLDKNYIDDLYLVQGYPQIYFIDSLGYTKEIQIGGLVDVSKSKTNFINSLKKIL